MDDSEEESLSDIEDISDIPEIMAKRKLPKYPQVSGWENDTDGVEDERNPDDSPSCEILFAAENGDVEKLKNLVTSDSSLINVTDKDGYSPLHRASYNNHGPAVKTLLELGADLSAKTIDGWQPLHSACKWNSLQCAELLINYGADVNAVSDGGITPLHLAAGNSEAAQLVQLLLSHPLLTPNIKDKSGDTPTDIAVRMGPNAFLFEPHNTCFL